ncbi:hypothetical protein HAX54_018621, partial [Datura stramonium]|nr:hypothetical protein [Datura stramonium]
MSAMFNISMRSAFSRMLYNVLFDKFCQRFDYVELWKSLFSEVYRMGSLSTLMTKTSETMLATKCR